MKAAASTTIAAAVLLAAVLLAPGARAEAPVFSDDLTTGPSTNGAVALAWAPPAAWKDVPVEYELRGVGDRDDAPDLLYRHFNTKTFVSGLTDGVYTFRVRGRRSADEAWTEWSTPYQLVVAHHDLRLALALCAAGAVVFVVTAAFVLAGARRAEAPDV